MSEHPIRSDGSNNLPRCGAMTNFTQWNEQISQGAMNKFHTLRCNEQVSHGAMNEIHTVD